MACALRFLVIMSGGLRPCALRPLFDGLRAAPCVIKGPRTEALGQVAAPQRCGARLGNLVFDNRDRFAARAALAQAARGALDAAPGFL